MSDMTAWTIRNTSRCEGKLGTCSNNAFVHKISCIQNLAQYMAAYDAITSSSCIVEKCANDACSCIALWFHLWLIVWPWSCWFGRFLLEEWSFAIRSSKSSDKSDVGKTIAMVSSATLMYQCPFYKCNNTQSPNDFIDITLTLAWLAPLNENAISSLCSEE